MNISPEIRHFLNTPIRIGGRSAPGRLLIAPMAGYTHVAFRELMAHFGGYGLLFTEMCSAKAVPHENPKHSLVFRWRREELPNLVCQLFGADASIMAEAARRVAAEGFFGVDINFGCSVAAVCKRGAGAALLKTPDRAGAMVAAVRKAVSVPVTVKYRTGWADDPGGAAEMARRFEDAGADALTFHPRVAPDRRTRPPRWEYIGRVKEAVGIPVFGNGEVFDAEDVMRMLQTTGCDGVSIGRIALSSPWLPAVWTRGPGAGPPVGNDLYRFCAKRMMDLMRAHFEPVTALRRYKKWALFFAAGFRFGHRFSADIRGAKDIDAICAVIDKFFAGDPERNPRPNMHLFR